MKLWIVRLGTRFIDYEEDIIHLVRAASPVGARRLAAEFSSKPYGYSKESYDRKYAEWMSSETTVELVKVEGDEGVILTSSTGA